MKCIKIWDKYVKILDNIAKICDDIGNVCDKPEKIGNDIANICDKCVKTCDNIGDVHYDGRIIHFKNGRYLDFLKVAFGKLSKGVAGVECSIRLKKHHRNFLAGNGTMLYSFGYNQEFIFL